MSLASSSIVDRVKYAVTSTRRMLTSTWRELDTSGIVVDVDDPPWIVSSEVHEWTDGVLLTSTFTRVLVVSLCDR